MLSLLRALAALRSKVGRGSCKTGGLHSGSFTPGMPHDGTHLGCLMTVHAPHGDCSARCPESLPDVGALVLCPCGPGKDGLFCVVRRTCCQRRRAPHPMDHSADNWRCRGRIHLPEACFRTSGTWIDRWCSTHAAGWHPLSGYCEVTPMRPRMFCNSLCVCRSANCYQISCNLHVLPMPRCVQRIRSHGKITSPPRSSSGSSTLTVSEGLYLVRSPLQLLGLCKCCFCRLLDGC